MQNVWAFVWRLTKAKVKEVLVTVRARSVVYEVEALTEPSVCVRVDDFSCVFPPQCAVVSPIKCHTSRPLSQDCQQHHVIIISLVPQDSSIFCLRSEQRVCYFNIIKYEIIMKHDIQICHCLWLRPSEPVRRYFCFTSNRIESSSSGSGAADLSFQSLSFRIMLFTIGYFRTMASQKHQSYYLKRFQEI